MMNMADKYSKDHVKKRRSRCGQCGPCQVKEDCGKCKYCQNKQVLKQSCMYRKCLYLRCKPAHETRSNLDSSFSEGELSKSGNSEYGVSSPTSTMPPSPMFGTPMWSSPTGNYMSTQVMSPYIPMAESVPANEMTVAAVDPVFPAPQESSASSVELSVNNWNTTVSENKIKTEVIDSNYGSASSQHQQQQQQQHQQQQHQPQHQAPSYEQIKMQEFLHSKPIPSPHPAMYNQPHSMMPPHHMGDPRANRMMGHPQHMPGLMPAHPMNGMQPHLLHSPGGWAMPTCSEHLYPVGYPRTSVPQIGGPLLAGLGPPPSPSIMPTMEVFNVRQHVPGELPSGVVPVTSRQEECIISIDNTAIPAYVRTDGLNNVDITTVPNTAMGATGKDILSAAIEESGISDLAQQASMETEYSAISNHNMERQHHAHVAKNALEAPQGIILQQNLGAGGEIQINLPSNGIMVENVTIDEEMAKYAPNTEMLMYPNDIFAHQVM